MRFVHVVKMQKMVNIDKQKKKLYFDEHLVLVLFSSQISSHCFIYLGLQDFSLLRLRGLPWILQVQSAGFPSIVTFFGKTYTNDISNVIVRKLTDS